MPKEIIAMIFSVLGMLVNMVSFQIKDKKPILILQSIGNILFLISFVFNGSGIAIMLNIIYLARNAIYMFTDGKSDEKKDRIYCIALCGAFIMTYFVYILVAGNSLTENLWDFAPVAASIFGTIATANTDVNKYRMWKLGDSFCWLFFNARFGVGALGGIVGEVFNQASLVIGILRYRKKKEE